MTYRNYLSIAYTDRPAKAAFLRTVLDTAPLTIEKVRTDKGTIAYKFHARQDKRPSAIVLKKIMKALELELMDVGIMKDRREYDKLKHARNRAHNLTRMKNYYHANKEVYNAKRRAKWAERKAAKQAMQELAIRE